MERGKIAGEVAIKAVKKRDSSVEILNEYEVRRRRSFFFGNLQKHDFKIK
jgi:flavin-dependent dehydrogenase